MWDYAEVHVHTNSERVAGMWHCICTFYADLMFDSATDNGSHASRRQRGWALFSALSPYGNLYAHVTEYEAAGGALLSELYCAVDGELYSCDVTPEPCLNAAGELLPSVTRPYRRHLVAPTPGWGVLICGGAGPDLRRTYPRHDYGAESPEDIRALLLNFAEHAAGGRGLSAGLPEPTPEAVLALLAEVRRRRADPDCREWGVFRTAGSAARQG